MSVIKTSIDGVLIIEPRIFEDARGYFFESFSQREFDEKVCPITFVQDNESKSSYGVMRGLHFLRQYQPLRYMTDLLHHNLLTVPDKQNGFLGHREGVNV